MHYFKKEASKENNESEEKTENKEESKDDLPKEDESGVKKDLEVVSGGKAGTMSNLVVDREVWNDFIEEKDNNLNYFLYHCQPYNCSKGSKKNDNCYVLSSHIKDKNP